MILTLGSVAGLAFYSFLSAKQSQKKAEQQNVSELILLQPLEITLLKNDSGTEGIYGKLKIQLSLQTPDKKAKEYILTYSAKYLDKVNEVLSGKKIENFQDSNPSFLVDKQLKLKQELLTELNTLSPSGRIEAVFFNEYFISET